uniref:Uncharacterized protein n=1 Tax=Timema cristinae TaxID=61476 RepID=A0A7R9D5H2_TIMCR|nr:unnamed protein product [Timema cristinae]
MSSTKEERLLGSIRVGRRPERPRSTNTAAHRLGATTRLGTRSCVPPSDGEESNEVAVMSILVYLLNAVSGLPHVTNATKPRECYGKAVSGVPDV